MLSNKPRPSPEVSVFTAPRAPLSTRSFLFIQELNYNSREMQLFSSRPRLSNTLSVSSSVAARGASPHEIAPSVRPSPSSASLSPLSRQRFADFLPKPFMTGEVPNERSCCRITATSPEVGCSSCRASPKPHWGRNSFRISPPRFHRVRLSIHFQSLLVPELGVTGSTGASQLS